MVGVRMFIFRVELRIAHEEFEESAYIGGCTSIVELYCMASPKDSRVVLVPIRESQGRAS